MKTLIRTIAASMIIAGTAALSTTAVAQVEKQDEKVEIRMTEVPSSVSETISSDYADWKASKVYKVIDPKTSKTVYEVHFTSPQGAPEKKKFSAEGKELDG
ncbi:hypothetical protein JMN32_13895 [Fulvivirga sp. 29W222]|uniref:PepSY domain-containing protein n=1 Tax=Fulvivirga marina TaxID=2494733 RepID=A0A937FZV2_9BACT|nr:hypothetical protein [Fulvivirga marina]MBL6447405.1 hypothetical protein [Fulvivirga marina]